MIYHEKVVLLSVLRLKQANAGNIIVAAVSINS